MRPEHLEPFRRRIAANEKVLRIMVTGQLIDIIYEHIDPDATTKIEEIHMSLSADKGEYVFEDFRDAINEVLAKKGVLPKLPEHIQHQIQICLDYLFPA